MAELFSRDNHYVPQWYQRAFLAAGETELYVLDLQPETISIGGGRTKTLDWPRRRSPSGAFVERDLYTTRFGAALNDEIERQLFGAIDTRGSNAVRAYVGGDAVAMHETFEDLFEYLDAQKLRTPKGLDWIKTRYVGLDQLQLMREMQGLRTMHCTMWAEGIREIVSAADSDVKFIVSDHPVTVYNPSYSPDSAQCAYPDDPSIALVGTQTAFALDPNTCLIFTHIEYGASPNDAKPTAERTYARFRGHGLVRTDAFIRKRRLTRDEVTSINFLLKSRAARYIASSDKAWLYPERTFSGSWADIANVLLPRDDLWQFGGEIYVGYKDGSVHYQDPFGRTSGSHEYLAKPPLKEDRAPNDLCGCGSGKKYRRCCKPIPQEYRTTWSVRSIRERNLALCRAITDILGLNKGKSWEDVRRELSAEQVAQINEFYARMWPKDTDLVELLPRPARPGPRALYLGLSDPRTVTASVLGWVPYFGEIVLAHPFINAGRVKPDFSPVASAAKHKSQTLKNAFLMLLLEPFIHAGSVHLVPDPSDFDSHFQSTVMTMAKDRTNGLRLHQDDERRSRFLGRDEFTRVWMRAPKQVLRQEIRRTQPDLTEKQVEDLIDLMRQKQLEDPFALLQELESGERGAEYMILTGFSLESALYLAILTESVVYTDSRTQWEQLMNQARPAGGESDAAWAELAARFSSQQFSLALEPGTLSEAVSCGRVARSRRPLRWLLDGLRVGAPNASYQAFSKALTKAESAMRREWQRTPSGMRCLGKIEAVIPKNGFERNEVRRLLLTYGRAKQMRSIPMAMFTSLEPADSE